MATASVLLLAERLKPLDELYTLLSNLTVLAETKHTELDKQVAIEETRKGMLDEARERIREVEALLNDMLPNPDLDLGAIEKTIAQFLLLLQQIHVIDQGRSDALRAERETLQKSLHQVQMGRQAVATYQRTTEIKD